MLPTQRTWDTPPILLSNPWKTMQQNVQILFNTMLLCGAKQMDTPKTAFRKKARYKKNLKITPKQEKQNFYTRRL